MPGNDHISVVCTTKRKATVSIKSNSDQTDEAQ